jgi:hypothetical protein
MPVIRLVCWKEELAREHARTLKDAGFDVNATPLNPSGVIGHFRANPVAAVVIDLDRLPSYGREVAAALRQSKTTRHLPIVFAGGVEEKVEPIRRELPDACFTDWKRIAGALKKALKQAPADPVRPVAHMERYAGSPLIKKLGIKPDMRTALLNAPEGVEDQLGDLPEGARLETKITRQTGLVIWFVRSRRELEAETAYAAARLPEGASVWIVHPKQASRFKVDFNQNDVRLTGLAAGLVDYKVCAVDADWSGLKFARKKIPRVTR